MLAENITRLSTEVYITTHHNPVSDGGQSLLTEQQVFEPSQRPIRVHAAALLKDVAVTLEVVARSSCCQRNIAIYTK